MTIGMARAYTIEQSHTHTHSSNHIQMVPALLIYGTHINRAGDGGSDPMRVDFYSYCGAIKPHMTHITKFTDTHAQRARALAASISNLSAAWPRDSRSLITPRTQECDVDGMFYVNIIQVIIVAFFVVCVCLGFTHIFTYTCASRDDFHIDYNHWA